MQTLFLMFMESLENNIIASTNIINKCSIKSMNYNVLNLGNILPFIVTLTTSKVDSSVFLYILHTYLRHT